MQLDSHIQSIQQDLAATAGLGDEATARAAQRLTEALGSTLHLRLLDLIGEAALEIGGQLGSGRVEVRLAGREPELVVVIDESSDAIHAASGEELTGRISLRLPESLKNGIEEAAAQEGVSTNAWLVRAIARLLDSRSHHRRGRNRIQGYAQG
ncbi:MAG: toxin-antitoxin system HicB family antitoxin [Actinobacteria bacterium]|nr:toxin-antitoxin system HicB family antitoxin [Actinomycetota bacterium]